MAFDYACAQTSSGTGYAERYVLGEGTAPLERRVDLPPSHVRATTRGAALRIHSLITFLLRWAARALYFFPVLVVAKIVLFFRDDPWSDYLTVGFVLLVVTFFAIFALTILSYAFVGPRSKRKGRMKLVFAPPRTEDLERVVASVVPNATVRMTGRVEAALEPGAPVLVEEWSLGERLGRFVEGNSFAVLPDDDDGTPCIVEIAAAPVFVARYSEGDDNVAALTVASKLGTRESAPTSRCVVRQGQRVVIVARTSQPSTRVEDSRLLALIAKDGPAVPYRGSESPGILVRSTPEEQVVIQLVD